VNFVWVESVKSSHARLQNALEKKRAAAFSAIYNVEGAPTTLYRILGTRFGVKAFQLANEGHFGSMVSYQNYQVRQVPIAEAVNRLKLVPPSGEMVQTARDVDISFGD
jgi:6-phosphofructokinase